MKFTVASYNVLADAYIRAKYYPNTDPKILEATPREERLIQRVLGLNADIICLQEVEPSRFKLISSRLSPQYLGYYRPKEDNRPDGCALFHRVEWKFMSEDALFYQEGGRRSSGHVAQTVKLKRADYRIAVSNTHLKWDRRTPPLHIGWIQAGQLIEHRARIEADVDAWVLCGDLNSAPESPVVKLLSEAGLSYAAQGQELQSTCAANGRAAKLDYVFYTGSLDGRLMELPEIDGRTVMPSDQEPSDHLPIVAELERAESVVLSHV